MGKVLVLVRVSTDAQETDGQRSELVDFVRSNGYRDEDMIIIESSGASAIKLNEKYLDIVDTIEHYVKSGEVNCVAVWHINRLGRDDRVLTNLKHLFITHKCQFMCKNPTLFLLNPDGSVNSGTELAYSLFSTLVKQDMAEKMEKFKRTKRRYAQEGRYCGGGTILWGYDVVDSYYTINEESAEIIRLIFDLYSTGKYSAYRIAKELNDRGYTKNGSPFYTEGVNKIINNIAYCGEPIKTFNNRVYPAIITKELFDKCAEIVDRNRKGYRRSRTSNDKVLAQKLIKCPKCGRAYMSNGKEYRCCYHAVDKKYYCDNNIYVNIQLMDSLLWRVASTEHIFYLMEMNEEKLEEHKKELQISEDKLTVLNTKINTINDKKQRIIDSYVEGLINKEVRDNKLQKVKAEADEHNKTVNTLKESITKLQELINSYRKEDIDAVINNGIDALSNQDKYNIVHRHIKNVNLERYPNNGLVVTIQTITGKEYKWLYYRYAKINEKKYLIWNGSDWVSDVVKKRGDIL